MPDVLSPLRATAWQRTHLDQLDGFPPGEQAVSGVSAALRIDPIASRSAPSPALTLALGELGARTPSDAGGRRWGYGAPL